MIYVSIYDLKEEFLIILQHHYKAAVFWADKVVSLSNGSPADVYWLAQSYYLTKQYHRAILLINGHKLTRVLDFS